jgi:hypothetical protein
MGCADGCDARNMAARLTYGRSQEAWHGHVRRLLAEYYKSAPSLGAPMGLRCLTDIRW